MVAETTQTKSNEPDNKAQGGNKKKKVPAIEVQASPEKGFYRAGRHWSHEKTTVPLSALGKTKAEQDAAVKAIMDEPKLIAQLIEIEA